jgi:uncharacterized protein YbjT (DUF2867 family)
MAQEFPIVIIGGNAPVVPFLMQRLKAKGYVAEVISRRGTAVPDGFTLTQMDLTESRNWIAPVNAVVINLLPMRILTQFLPRFIGVKAIIAHGDALRSIAAEEERLRSWAERSNVAWTLLRAAIVYDCRTDQNITRMAKFIRRWHCLALTAPASGLRQPIHADDAAHAVIAAIDNPAAQNKAIDIAGSETLPYKEMALRVFAALKMEPHIVMLPDGAQKALTFCAQAGLARQSLARAFERMNKDVVCDPAEGLRILDYQPRGFRPEFL